MDKRSNTQAGVERELSKGFPYIAVSSRCLTDPSPAAKKYCRTDPSDKPTIKPGCDGGCSECYIEVPYEEAGSLIMGSRNAIKCGFMIMWEGYDECLLVEEGVAAHAIEVEGYKVHGIVSEGDKITKGDKIAYVATRKGEVRSVRSGFEGLVIYVAQKPESRPERFIFIVVGERDVRRARLARDR